MRRAFRGHIAGSLVRERGVVGRLVEISAVIARVGDVEAILAGIGVVAEGFAIAEEEGFEAQLRLLRAERQERPAEQVLREVDRVAGASYRELVRDLRRFAAQV